MPSLDQVDRRIVAALRRNARVTNVALAGDVGLSASACLRRVQILEESGVIRGYTAIVSGPGARDGHTVIVRISLERQTEDVLNRFEAAVLKHPEIRECYLMTGEEDYLLRVEVEGSGDYERIHKEVLSRLPACRASILASPSAAFCRGRREEQPWSPSSLARTPLCLPASLPQGERLISQQSRILPKRSVRALYLTIG